MYKYTHNLKWFFFFRSYNFLSKNLRPCKKYPTIRPVNPSFELLGSVIQDTSKTLQTIVFYCPILRGKVSLYCWRHAFQTQDSKVPELELTDLNAFYLRISFHDTMKISKVGKQPRLLRSYYTYEPSNSKSQ